MAAGADHQQRAGPAALSLAAPPEPCPLQLAETAVMPRTGRKAGQAAVDQLGVRPISGSTAGRCGPSSGRPPQAWRYNLGCPNSDTQSSSSASLLRRDLGRRAWAWARFSWRGGSGP